MTIPRDTKAKFIEKSRHRWGDRFGYDQVHYVNSRTPVLLFCKEHQTYFPQTPKAHFMAKHACCPICYEELAGTFQNAWRQQQKNDVCGQRFRGLMHQVFAE